MHKVILRVCLLLGAGKPGEAVLIINGVRMFPVQLEVRGVIWVFSSPEFVQEFIGGLDDNHDIMIVVVGYPIVPTILNA